MKLFKESVMEICSNCFKQTSQAYPFCPHCGYPNVDVGLKNCPKGHTIYETYKNCPFCGQMVFVGKSVMNKGPVGHGDPRRTELLAGPNPYITEEIAPMGRVVVNENPSIDKTVLETTGMDKTVLEDEPLDRTKFESMTGFPDKTVLEAEVDKTVLDEGEREPLPPFFAWLVYVDEEGKPLHDERLTRPKRVIGKGADADIRLKDDFASKLHAVIHFEEGRFFLSDLGSTNHTWLNEKKIMKEELNDGDKIRIGRQDMIFKRVRRSL